MGFRAQAGLAGPAPDRRGKAFGHLGETRVAAGQQCVQVFHVPWMAAGQPPYLADIRFVQQAERGQRRRQPGSAGRGERADVPGHQGLPGTGQHERVPAGDQQPGQPGRAGQARQQPGERRVLDGRSGRARGQVVVKVVQDDQDRHLAQDVVAEQVQPVTPRQIGPAGRRQGPGTAAGRGHRVPPQRAGQACQQRVGGDFAAEGHGETAGLQSHGPRDDLRGQCGLADSARAVQHHARHAGSEQVRAPAPALGRPDRRGREPPAWPGSAGVTGVNRQVSVNRPESGNLRRRAVRRLVLRRLVLRRRAVRRPAVRRRVLRRGADWLARGQGPCLAHREDTLYRQGLAKRRALPRGGAAPRHRAIRYRTIWHGPRRGPSTRGWPQRGASGPDGAAPACAVPDGTASARAIPEGSGPACTTTPARRTFRAEY